MIMLNFQVSDIVPIFREMKIDGVMLRDLTEEQLREAYPFLICFAIFTYNC